MKFLIVTVLLVLAFTLGFATRERFFQKAPEEIATIVAQIEKPLEKYSLNNLESTNPGDTTLKIEEVMSQEDLYTSHLFSLNFDPSFSLQTPKKVTGQINIPSSQVSESNEFPLVVMFRGFVSQEMYATGVGTHSAAAVFAENGFITLAPDFLGYAGSDKESGNVFETRFQTYTTALAVLNSLSQIREWDGKNVFIWAHSNGGQIALTTLAVTGIDHPTTLWAPVTKPFPYSILYFTDESVDRGKFLRAELAKFEAVYDVEEYSFDNHLEKINAPIQLHQGTADDAIPVSWSNAIVSRLKALDKEVNYFVYPGADHNLRPDWDTVVERDLDFFKSSLQE